MIRQFYKSRNEPFVKYQKGKFVLYLNNNDRYHLYEDGSLEFIANWYSKETIEDYFELKSDKFWKIRPENCQYCNTDFSDNSWLNKKCENCGSPS